MHTSGITVSQEMGKAFHEAVSDKDVLFVKYSIDLANDCFVQNDVVKSTGSGRDADFELIQKHLEAKQPCYIILRGENPDQFVCVFFVPDNSPVRAKMVFASSNQALKTGLGAKFETEFPVGKAEECTYSEYKKVFAATIEDNVMTWQERDAKAAIYETHTGFDEVKVSAIMGIPIPAAENVEPNLKGLIAKVHDTVELILDPKTEVLGSEAYNISISDLVANKLPAKEPRYFIHNYKLTHEGKEEEKFVFIYYCPASCVPRQKMFYSSSKATILKLFDSLGLTEITNLEADTASEISDTIITNEIHPPQAEDTSFKKPKAKGRAGGGRPRVAKFQA